MKRKKGCVDMRFVNESNFRRVFNNIMAIRSPEIDPRADLRSKKSREEMDIFRRRVKEAQIKINFMYEMEIIDDDEFSILDHHIETELFKLKRCYNNGKYVRGEEL
jgi:hypothetical protein